ncbi:unnamed protein product [Caenorhabditis sp. 36 PRJEB53466]|nr:unnamed protein product [Caenorhabditis sp. 36 PRJEB53466]
MTSEESMELIVQPKPQYVGTSPAEQTDLWVQLVHYVLKDSKDDVSPYRAVYFVGKDVNTPKTEGLFHKIVIDDEFHPYFTRLFKNNRAELFSKFLCNKNPFAFTDCFLNCSVDIAQILLENCDFSVAENSSLNIYVFRTMTKIQLGDHTYLCAHFGYQSWNRVKRWLPEFLILQANLHFQTCSYTIYDWTENHELLQVRVKELFRTVRESNYNPEDLTPVCFERIQRSEIGIWRHLPQGVYPRDTNWQTEGICFRVRYNSDQQGNFRHVSRRQYIKHLFADFNNLEVKNTREPRD